MIQQQNSKIKRLESLLDLDSLQDGDVIDIRYIHYPYKSNNTIEVTGMYHINPLHPNSNRLSFLIPLENYCKPIILLYKIRKDDAKVEDGKLVMYEKVSKISQFYSNMNLYKYFEAELKKHTNLIK